MNISKENVQTPAAGSNAPISTKPQTTPGNKPVTPEVIGEVMPKDAAKKTAAPMPPREAGKGNDEVMSQPQKSA